METVEAVFVCQGAVIKRMLVSVSFRPEKLEKALLAHCPKKLFGAKVFSLVNGRCESPVLDVSAAGTCPRFLICDPKAREEAVSLMLEVKQEADILELVGLSAHDELNPE